jgi:glutathione synthase/RimK-type ligase-like ATP-grasp enzyme
MGTIGIFVDRQTLSYSKKLSMLMRFRDVAESLGHRSYFIFPVELKKIVKLDGLLIRSRTDPLNVSYVAARMATLHGIPVIDNPESIRVCSDKVNMYLPQWC